MLFPDLLAWSDAALLLLRLLLALLFATSGWSHVARPQQRAESIGLPPAATFALGLAELAGALSIALGLLPQLGALLLIAIMLGALYKKALVWHTGFWGEEKTGWYYELLYIAGLFVILTTAGGTWTLTPTT